jgi:hypothetical protein
MARILSVPAANNLQSYIQDHYEVLQKEAAPVQWDYQKRGPRGAPVIDAWTTRGGMWPSRSGFCGDPATGEIEIATQDLGFSNGSFEPWLANAGGSQNLKFIRGRCVDATETAVASATVQIFLTADDTLQRETIADSSGYYEAGTDKTGAAHYLVAYKPGAPDVAGTTVNTLVPTNRDGS